MTGSDYLKHRGQPHTEEAFLETYHITMDDGRKAVGKVLKVYKEVNPWSHIRYELSFDKELLTTVFTLAGKNFRLFMLLLENEPCYCLPIHLWMANIAERMNLEEENGNK